MTIGGERDRTNNIMFLMKTNCELRSVHQIQKVDIFRTINICKWELHKMLNVLRAKRVRCAHQYQFDLIRFFFFFLVKCKLFAGNMSYEWYAKYLMEFSP